MRVVWVAALLLVGCAAGNKARIQTPDATASLFDLLPSAPKGFDKASEAVLRDRETIYEQINGGSVSYLENGMIDALFVTFPRGAHEGQELIFEIYRFAQGTGAAAQFKQVNGDQGTAWENGSRAVIHEYGIELVVDRYLLRAGYNDGPEPLMSNAAKSLARQLLGRMSQN